MATKCVIENLTDTNKFDYKIMLRLVHVYEYLAYNKREIQSLECVFHDSKENRIEATVPKNLIAHFAKQLEVGKLFGIKNFKLVVNTKKFKVSMFRYKIIFIDATQLTCLLLDKFPYKRFWFKTFQEVQQLEDVDEEPLLDIIGSLVEVEPMKDIKTSNGSQLKLLNIRLEDDTTNRLWCTLWNDYADQFNKLIEGQVVHLVVVIIQCCKADDFKERKLGTVLHATKIIVNADFEEVLTFRSRLPVGGTIEFSVTQGMTQSIAEDYVEGVTKTKTAMQLFEEDEAGTFWISGKIIALDFQFGWNYISCPKCMKKMIKLDNKFSCPNCIDESILPLLRYKLAITVQDDTGTIPLMMWDKETSEIIGQSASELHNQYGMDGKDEPQDFITEALLQKKFHFRIRVKTNGSIHSVTKISPAVVTDHIFPDTQESNCISEPNDGSHIGTPSSKNVMNICTPTEGSHGSSKTDEASEQSIHDDSWLVDDVKAKRSLDEALSVAGKSKKKRESCKLTEN